MIVWSKYAMSVLNYNFSKEESMLPESLRMIVWSKHVMSVLNCNFSKEQNMYP